MALSHRQKTACHDALRYLQRDYQQVADRQQQIVNLAQQYGSEVQTYLLSLIDLATWQAEMAHTAAIIAGLDQVLQNAEGDGIEALLEDSE